MHQIAQQTGAISVATLPCETLMSAKQTINDDFNGDTLASSLVLVSFVLYDTIRDAILTCARKPT